MLLIRSGIVKYKIDNSIQYNYFPKLQCNFGKYSYTATHALSYNDDITNYTLSVYKNKTRQTFANLPVTLVINISLYLWLQSRR